MTAPSEPADAPCSGQAVEMHPAPLCSTCGDVLGFEDELARSAAGVPICGACVDRGDYLKPVEPSVHGYSPSCRCWTCATRREFWRARGFEMRSGRDWRGERDG